MFRFSHEKERAGWFRLLIGPNVISGTIFVDCLLDLLSRQLQFNMRAGNWSRRHNRNRTKSSICNIFILFAQNIGSTGHSEFSLDLKLMRLILGGMSFGLSLF